MKSLRLLVMTINVMTAVAVLLVALVAWFVNSESGARRAVAFAAARLPGSVEIGSVGGTLAGGVVLRDIVLHPGHDRVAVEQALLTWSASSLLARAAVLNEVAARGVVWSSDADRSSPTDAAGGSVAAAGGSAAAGSTSSSPRAPVAGRAAGSDARAARAWPSAPFPIVVRSGSIERLSLRFGDASHDFAAAALAGRWVGREVVVTELRTESAGIAITARGDAALMDPVALAVELSWAGDVDGQRAAGTLHLEGRLPALELRHDLILPLTAVATGEIRLTDPLRAEAGFVVETDSSSFAAAGELSLATTEWDLTIRPLGTEAAPPRSQRPLDGDGRSRFEGRLFPQLDWRFSALDARAKRESGGAETN